MKFFNNKYRIDSTRLADWDYTNNGIYFITICTYAKQHFFGEIKTDVMHLSQVGIISKKYLNEIPSHFANTEIDVCVIMPNHVHILLKINTQKSSVEKLKDKVSKKGILDEDIFIDVRDTLNRNVAAEGKNEFMSHISPKKGSISTIIRSYKSAVSKEAKKINPDFS